MKDLRQAHKKLIKAAIRWKKVFSYEIEPKRGLRYEEKHQAMMSEATDDLFLAVEELESHENQIGEEEEGLWV
jgi:hypothetical protein